MTLVKLLTSAGVYKDIFALNQITSGSQADGSGFELGAFDSIQTRGRYSKEERDQITEYLNSNLANPFEGVIEGTGHPNAGGFVFKNAIWQKRIESFKGGTVNSTITSNADIDGIYRASASEVRLRDSSGNYTAETDESLPRVDFQVTNTSGTNKVDLTPVAVGSNNLREATDLVSVHTNASVTLSKQSGTGPNTITKGSAVSGNMSLTDIVYSYHLTNLSVKRPGSGFADASGVQVNFPAPKTTLFQSSSQTASELNFTTLADKNYTFTVGYAAKTVQVKYSAYQLDEIFNALLNGEGRDIPYKKGFYELTEQY